MEKLKVPYEAKVKNRFIVTLPEEFEIQNFHIKGIQLPSISIDESGNKEWNQMKIFFYDPIGPSTSQSLFKLHCATNENEVVPISDEITNLVKNGFKLKIEILDPCGVTVSVWEIHECKITNIDFGSLDYADSGMIICSITVKPKVAYLLY